MDFEKDFRKIILLIAILTVVLLAAVGFSMSYSLIHFGINYFISISWVYCVILAFYFMAIGFLYYCAYQFVLMNRIYYGN